MGFNDELNKITNDLLGVFFPRKCPFCGRGVDRKSLLCQPCSDTLPRCGRGTAAPRFAYRKKEFLCWKIIKVHCAQGSAPIVPA